MTLQFCEMNRPFVDFERPSSEKERFKKKNFFFVYSIGCTIPKLYGLLVYSVMIFWDIALHVSVLEPKFSQVLTFTISLQKCCKGIFILTLLF